VFAGFIELRFREGAIVPCLSRFCESSGFPAYRSTRRVPFASERKSFYFGETRLKWRPDFLRCSMIFSPAALQSALPAPTVGIWWVALSGGLDSCVLLHALDALKLPVQLRALHINHQISPNADSWQQHCQLLCESLGVSFTAVNVVVKNQGRGIEDAAREARYGVFEQHIQSGDYLFTAHHADDQSETLLLRLMRGTGPRGLAAMARNRPLGEGTLYRPLLGFTREELEAYAQNNGLVWVTDESNADDHYDRNYLRNQVMPLLRDRWPAFAEKWQQTAELCAANEQLIDELAAQDLLLAGFRPDVIGTSISLLYTSSLSQPRRHNLLRHWLRRQGLDTPEQQHLIQIEQQIIAGRQDAEVQVNWGNLSLRVYQARVYALPSAALPKSVVEGQAITVIPEQDQLLPTGGVLRLCQDNIDGLLMLRADLPDLNIRFRRGGERCKPAGRRHSQTLKRLLQEYQLAPWLRESLPLIYSGDELVAVGDLWVCEGFQTDSDGYRVLLRWPGDTV
jgi:tRNA(Ile)-lysidine synthase